MSHLWMEVQYMNAFEFSARYGERKVTFDGITITSAATGFDAKRQYRIAFMSVMTLLEHSASMRDAFDYIKDHGAGMKEMYDKRKEKPCTPS